MSGLKRTPDESRRLHPAKHDDALTSAILIIAPKITDQLDIELILGPLASVRSVRAAADTEGIGDDVVVIGGSYPVAELIEVRAHPRLYNKPVVLFTPGRTLPEPAFRSKDIYSVGHTSDPASELLHIVGELLSPHEGSRELLG